MYKAGEFSALKKEDIAFVSDMDSEATRAYIMYKVHPTLEHSFMVLQEEVEELKQELYRRPADRSFERIRSEAVQVAAMAMRLVTDYEKNTSKVGHDNEIF